jgi:two-component system, sensor histidine kinase and response regulator
MSLYDQLKMKSKDELIQELIERIAMEEVDDLTGIIHQSTDSIVLTDLEGNIKYVNPMFEKISGYTLQEALGQNPRFLKSEKNPLPQEYYKEMWQTLSNGDIWRGEFTNRRKNGEEYIEEASIFPVKSKLTGEITGYGAVKKDITEKRKMEQELNNLVSDSVSLKEKAEDSNSLKSEFLAAMSHDIRTPLNAIMGFTDLLLKKERREHSQKYLKKIELSGQALLNLINDILDFSKIEAGQLDIYKQSFRLKELTESLRNLFDFQFKEKGIQFQLRVSNTVPATLFNDKWRLNQVLTNLLSNALKFTDTGEVILSADYLEETDLIVFHVMDSGIGIHKKDLQRIFDPFYQIKSTQKEERKGTGLGLSICTKLSQLMGGSLTVKSQLGIGTEFIVQIPAHLDQTSENNIIEETKEEPETLKEEKTGNTILIAEDNVVNRELIKEQLNNAGFYFLLFAENGEEAVELAMEHKPDLILMDVIMPIMDGNKAIKLLKQKNYEGPILTLSALAMREDIDLSLEAGADGYITKPIDFTSFFQKICAYLKVKKHKPGNSEFRYIGRRINDDMDLNIKGAFSDNIKMVFISDIKNKLNCIDDIFTSGEFKEKKITLQNIAHGFRGNAGYFGLLPLQSIAGQMDNAFIEDKDEPLMIELTKILATVLEKIIQQNIDNIT